MKNILTTITFLLFTLVFLPSETFAVTSQERYNDKVENRTSFSKSVKQFKHSTKKMFGVFKRIKNQTSMWLLSKSQKFSVTGTASLISFILGFILVGIIYIVMIPNATLASIILIPLAVGLTAGIFIMAFGFLIAYLAELGRSYYSTKSDNS